MSRNGVDAVSKFLALKVHKWRGSYQRVFSFGEHLFQTLDPATFAVTNAWPYKDILGLEACADNDDQFLITLPSSGGMFSSSEVQLRFSTPHRLPLISELHRLRCLATDNLGRGRPHQQNANKYTRTGDRRASVVIVGPIGLIVTRRPAPGEKNGLLLSKYPYKDIRQIRLCKDDDQGIIFVIYGRGRLFFVENRDKLMGEIKAAAIILGLKLSVNGDPVTINQCRASRARLGQDDGLPALAEFFVEKHTPKHDRPVTRRLIINEETIVERDKRTYGVVSLRPLSQVFALVQSWNHAQRLAIEYVDGTTVWYDCSDRGTLLATLLDCCHSCGNKRVCVNAAVGGGGAGLRFIPRDAMSEEALEASFLKRIVAAYKGGDDEQARARASSSTIATNKEEEEALSPAAKKANAEAAKKAELELQKNLNLPYQTGVESVARELNANVSFEGLSSTATKASSLFPAMVAIIVNLDKIIDSNVNVQSSVTVTFLQALKRMLSTNVGYRGWTKLPVGKEADKIEFANKLVKILTKTLRASDSGIVYWTLEVLYALCGPKNGEDSDRQEDEESQNKAAILTERMINLFMALLDSDFDKDAAISPLVTMCLVRLIESILCTHGKTTRNETKQNLLMMVAARHTPVLRLLRSKCTAVRESVALLMGVMITDSPGSVPELIRTAALAEGVLLHQMRVAIFDPSPGRRFVSRYLVSLWLADHHRAGMSLLKRMVPSGLLHYLTMPGLTAEAADKLENEEPVGGAQASKRNEKRKAKRDGRLSRLRSRIQAQSGNGSSAIRSLKGENFAVFFHMATLDHTLPDLIWNQNTKTELRTSLESEEREFERERDLAGSNRVCWNYSEFEVYYPSLDNEIRIGNHYVRLLFDSGGVGDGAVRQLRNPAHFFECLYRRFLREKKPSLQALCLRAMALVHDHHNLKIPPFEDIAHILRVLATTRHVAIRDRTLLLLRSLVKKKDNAEMILRGHVAKGSGLNVEESLRILVLFMTLAHTQAEKRSANMIQATLLLTGGEPPAPSTATPAATPAPSQPGDPSASAPSKEDEEFREQWSAESKRRAAELAAEVMASKEWYYRPKGWKSGKTEPDPVTINGLRSLLEKGTITEYTPMRACGMQIWRPMRRVPQLKWQLLMIEDDDVEDSDNEEARELSKYATEGLEEENEGEEKEETKTPTKKRSSINSNNETPSNTPSRTSPSSNFNVAGEGKKVLEPRDIGKCALEILEVLVGMHKSVDSTGAAVRPPPRAKRLISDRREMQLTHVAQMMLTSEPDIVDLAAKLIHVTCMHNPKACSKLYLTGAFYFALGYTGSNFVEVSKMLKYTHLRQHHKNEGRQTLTSDGTLSERSFLACLLPECMLCIMENYGAEKFAEVFLGNFNTPEVIWKYSMRTHLVKMIDQHVGNVHARLVQNTATRFDLEFGPIPDVRFPELDEELWCENYYLGNLCDEARFPNWPIRDPIALLKGILDAWRQEEEKGLALKEGKEASMGETEAMSILQIKEKPDDEAKWEDLVRTKYRKLARKYHPDRNPEGRDMFESIQKAYELLSSARPQSVLGPDPVNIDLLLKTQCLLFRRFRTELAPYKYAGYPLLLQSLKLTKLHNLNNNAHILIHAAHLAYLTCLCCALNARELTRVKGVKRMSKLLIQSMMTVTNQTERNHPNLQIASHLLHSIAGLAAFEAAREKMVAIPALIKELVRCTALIQAPKTIHYSLEAIGRSTVDRRLQALLLQKGIVLYIIPLLLQFDEGLDNMSEAKEKKNSESAVAASEPAATEKKEADDGSSAVGKQGENVQEEANHSAKLGARALSRMGGYIQSKKLASPENKVMQLTMDAIMTPVIAKKLTQKKPAELLRALNDNCETPVMIWNGTMRKQLQDFIVKRIDDMTNGTQIDMHDMGSMIEYTNLASELLVDGVYIRVYNEHPDFVLPTPSSTVVELIKYMNTEFVVVSDYRRKNVKRKKRKKKRKSVVTTTSDAANSENPDEEKGEEEDISLCRTVDAAAKVLENCENHILDLQYERGELRGRGSGVMGPGDDRSRTRIQMCLESFINVLATHDVFDDVASNLLGIELILSYCEPDGDDSKYTDNEQVHRIRELALQLLNVIAPKKSCATTLSNKKFMGTLLFMLRKYDQLEKIGTGQSNRTAVLEILLALCSSTPCVKTLIDLGGLIDLLELFSRIDDAQGLNTTRSLSAKILCKILFDNTHGPKTMLTLGRIMPEGLVHEIREDASGAACRDSFDLDHETPELLWTNKTRSTLRSYLADQRQILMDTTSPGNFPSWVMDDNFEVKYPSIDGELRAAGVYIRIYLKDPKYALREPKRFIDETLRMFLGRAEEIVGRLDKSADDRRVLDGMSRSGKSAGPALGDGKSETKQIVLAQTDDAILTPLTSAAVCIMQVRETILPHVATLGYGPKFVLILARVTPHDPHGVLASCCVRMLYQFSGSKSIVKSIAAQSESTQPIKVLKETMLPMHKDAAFTIETMRKLLEQNSVKETSNSGGDLGGPMSIGGSDEHVSSLVREALDKDVNLIQFLTSILEGTVEGGDQVGSDDMSICKVHTVEIMHCLESDGLYGSDVRAQLDGLPIWEEYRHQKHDLFMSRNETKRQDYFLTYGEGYGPAGNRNMLEDASGGN